jgi:uncharacterized membrane protein
MLGALLTIFSGALALLLHLLPAGPDMPESVATLLQGGVAFAKGLQPLLATTTALTVLTAIITWEIGFASFRAMMWVYRRVTGR